MRQEKENECERVLTALNEDIQINDERIREKQTTVDILDKEHRKKQEDLEQLIQIDQDKTNVYAIWMSDCLKAIQNESRFHQKPIGPISKKSLSHISPHSLL